MVGNRYGRVSRQMDLAEGLLYSPNVRIALIIGGSLLGYVLLRRMLTGNSAQIKSNIERALSELHAGGVQPTIRSEYASLLAERLYTAMDGNGSDEAAIFDVFSQLHNAADLVLLMRAFGARPYGATGGNDSTVAKWLGWSTMMDLSGWLRRELSGRDLKRVAAEYKRLGMSL